MTDQNHEKERQLQSISYFGEDGQTTKVVFDSKNRFHVDGGTIAGPVITSGDGALAPEVPEGAVLLVDENTARYDGDGLYVFRKPELSPRVDIATLEKLPDGRYRYVSDKKAPETLADLGGLEFVGKVYDVMVRRFIPEFKLDKERPDEPVRGMECLMSTKRYPGIK